MAWSFDLPTYRHRGVELAARAFPKQDARVSQAAIVDNKLLAGALTDIRAKQEQRDQRALRARKLTLRDEDLKRQAMGETRLRNRRDKRPTLKPNSAELPAVEETAQPLLAHALAWAKDLQAARPPRKTRQHRRPA